MLCRGECLEFCSQRPSYYIARFHFILLLTNCGYATGWMGCIGTLDTGTTCGTVTATCE